LLKLLSEDRFPEIWMPSSEQRDLRTLLRDRHQWVRMRTRSRVTEEMSGGLRHLNDEENGPSRVVEYKLIEDAYALVAWSE
jgi:hypothetical protein